MDKKSAAMYVMQLYMGVSQQQASIAATLKDPVFDQPLVASINQHLQGAADNMAALVKLLMT